MWSLNSGSETERELMSSEVRAPPLVWTKETQLTFTELYYLLIRWALTHSHPMKQGPLQSRLTNAGTEAPRSGGGGRPLDV